MAEHTEFEKLVAEAKKNIREMSPTEAAAKLNSGEAVIVDVRDKDEWDEAHIPGALHMSRGTIELDIEEKVPDTNAMVICHCGGGGRGALATESLQKMGYTNVRNMAGGFKAWKAAGLPTTKKPDYQAGLTGISQPVGALYSRRATAKLARVTTQH